jgi:hypothetical protein
MLGRPSLLTDERNRSVPLLTGPVVPGLLVHLAATACGTFMTFIIFLATSVLS